MAEVAVGASFQHLGRRNHGGDAPVQKLDALVLSPSRGYVIVGNLELSAAKQMTFGDRSIFYGIGQLECLGQEM
jgi:hypothetical protein